MECSWWGSRMPLLGLTQYCFGAVVFTLKITVLLVGFFRVRLEVTTSVKGPRGNWGEGGSTISRWVKSIAMFSSLSYNQCQYKYQYCSWVTLNRFSQACGMELAVEVTRSIYTMLFTSFLKGSIGWAFKCWALYHWVFNSIGSQDQR